RARRGRREGPEGTRRRAGRAAQLRRQRHVEAGPRGRVPVPREEGAAGRDRVLRPAARLAARRHDDPRRRRRPAARLQRRLRGLFRFAEHPTGHSVLPTAATCTLTGFQHRGIPLLVSDIPVSLEQEPNDDPKAPQKLTLPVVLSGRFDRERDADWFEIEPPEGGPYSFEVYCERIAGRADPYLVVLDEKDGRVAELDDFGIRTNAFDGHLRDPSGTVNLAAKKKYRVLVQDRYRRGGARYQYVLVIRKPVPDFYPAVIHHQNPGPGGTTVRRGGATYLDVIVHNKEGFIGPVTITAEGLPEGLHAAPTTINGDNRGVVVLWADADAADWVGPVKLTATAKRGDE